MKTLQNYFAARPNLTKGYLMTAGAIMPGVIAVAAYAVIKKQNINLKDTKMLMWLAGGVVLGGILTSMMVKANTVEVPAETPAE